jgi:hypothetical protein
MGEWLYSIQTSVFMNELIAAAVNELPVQYTVCVNTFEWTGCAIEDAKVKHQCLKLPY